MGSVPFALSVHHFINSVGADAGFASIIGLAILVLLYFAQARETATLRDYAQEASQRIQQLEGRLLSLTRSPPPGAQPGVQAAAQPAQVGAPPFARQTAAAGAPTAARVASRLPGVPAGVGVAPSTPAPAMAYTGSPAAPAGVGAPALAAATKLIPTSAPETEPEAEPALAPAAEGVPAPAAAPASAPGISESWPAVDATAVATPPPSTAAASAAAAAPRTGTNGAGNGGARDYAGPAGPVPAGPGRGYRRAPGGGAQPAGRLQLRQPSGGPPRRPMPPPRGFEPERRGVPRALLALLGVIAIGAVVAVLLIATSGGGNQVPVNHTSTTNALTSHKSKHKSGAAFNPAGVTVSVLNGTSITGLAHRVAVRLGSLGYRQGTVATASDQTHTSTIVEFMPGHRGDATHVASSLHLGSGAVQSLDQSTQAVACPPPGACSSTVVVTVGTDLQNS